MVTAVALFQIWKLSAEKYLSFIMTRFLLKIGPKSSLQPGTVLFSDCWWVIGEGVLNYDPFHHEDYSESTCMLCTTDTMEALKGWPVEVYVGRMSGW